jgi:hypothetical protein
MIRNLKALGLALVAVFAITAVTASAASAQGKLTSDGPMTLLGTQTGEPVANALTIFGKTECPSATYTGHKVASTPHATIPSTGATQVTITPHYGHCVSGGFPSTISMNGCDYVFDIGATTGGIVGTYGVGTTIVCPVGKNIEIKTYTTTAHESIICTGKILHKAAQQYPGLHVSNGTNGHINIAGTITGIEAHRAGFCAPETQTTKVAEIHLDITVKDSGVTSVLISH